MTNKRGCRSCAEIYDAMAKTQIGFKKADTATDAARTLWDAVCKPPLPSTLERAELASAAIGRLVAGMSLAVADWKNKNHSGDDAAEVADEIINRIHFWAFEYLILHFKAERNQMKTQEEK